MNGLTAEPVKLYFKLLPHNTRTTQTNHVFCSNDENEHSMIIRYRSCSSKI
ncbi:unnamed protein product, partial [Brachionus calyciflorus]